MEHKFIQRVYYSDTDAYGVVWHGSYLRWMEMGRVEMCNSLGLNLVTLKEQDIALPVTNINIRYKASAKLNDNVIIYTRVKSFTPLMATFEQEVRNAEDEKLFVRAEVDVVATTSEGKLYRRMPEVISNSFKEAMND